jgi:electron transport complex protein RnfB
MPLTSIALVAAVFVAAFASGWLLGPALRARLDDADAPSQLRGERLTLLTAVLAGLPFAAIDTAHGWLYWLVASIGWAIALLKPASRRTASMREDTLIAAIDRVLPQTQCGQCGYPGCRPYAAAIASGEADINQCPPGGTSGVRKLADLLGRTPKPLNPEHGIEKPAVVALIVEEDCIGCTKCIQACPVDAIVGAPKRMHTVIADLCTGCELCLPPCPVDCIVLIPPPAQPTLAIFALNASS